MRVFVLFFRFLVTLTACCQFRVLPCWSGSCFDLHTPASRQSTHSPAQLTRQTCSSTPRQFVIKHFGPWKTLFWILFCMLCILQITWLSPLFSPVQPYPSLISKLCVPALCLSLSLTALLVQLSAIWVMPPSVLQSMYALCRHWQRWGRPERISGTNSRNLWFEE